MDLTESYQDVFPASVQSRYRFMETRNAASILEVTNPTAMLHLIAVLEGFALTADDLLVAGGNESGLAARLNAGFRDRGWREGQVDTKIRLDLTLQPYAKAGERAPTVIQTETVNDGYKVDCVLERVALDVEWNAKDGNLDRDLSAYRALYDAGLIDCAVMVTRTQYDLRELGARLASAAGSDRRVLATTTTTNAEKLRPRMTRGDAGGCPLLAVLICADTFSEEGGGGPTPTVESG